MRRSSQKKDPKIEENGLRRWGAPLASVPRQKSIYNFNSIQIFRPLRNSDSII